MIIVRPRLASIILPDENRNLAQLRAMGVSHAGSPGSRVGIRYSSGSGARHVLASTIADLTIRLEPLVSEVLLAGPEEGALADELAERYPVDVIATRKVGRIDFEVAVGPVSRSADLAVDGAGWVAALRAGPVEADDDGNPIGPLVAADFGAAEIFKHLFARVYPDSRYVPEFVPWSGQFSSYSYDFSASSPAISDVDLDALLVGCGGVTSGVLLVFRWLGKRLSGRIRLVDYDIIATHNLNRLLFASLQSAMDERLKVREARDYLARFAPNLGVETFDERFDSFKQRTPLRADRRFPLVVTGLDSDDVRHEVQREMPCVLIDGSTGSFTNCRVERVEFGAMGCLGCSRRFSDRPAGPGCDVFPDKRAPSIAFLSALPGIWAGGELIKGSLGDRGALVGHFEHHPIYGPNPDLRGREIQRVDCVVGCQSESVLAQFRAKCN